MYNLNAKVLKKTLKPYSHPLTFDIFCLFLRTFEIKKEDLYVSLSRNSYSKHNTVIMLSRFFNHTKRIFLTAILSLGTFHAMAQTEIEKFVPGVTIDGISYYLPRTAMRMVITVERKEVTPGEFCSYAFRYMRLQDVPVQSSVTWTVKDIDLHPYGIPDKDKAYSIKLKGRTVAPFVSLSSDGLLLGINTEVAETPLPPLPKSHVIEHDIKAADVRKFMTRDMLQAGSTAKMAELVAKEIYDIRESRDALIRGEADNTPKDGAQLKLMLDNLDNQQRTLTTLFAGTTNIQQHYYVVDIVPAEETEKLLLFRFSKWNGIVDADDMSGVPFYISIKRTEELPQPTFNPEVDIKKGKLPRAIFYNVPVRTMFKVFNAENTFAELETSVAQFGYEEILSNVLFDKRQDTKISFYQTTGGIKNIQATQP